MKALGRRETAMQIDQAIETRRAARSIVDGEPELNLKSPETPFPFPRGPPGPAQMYQ